LRYCGNAGQRNEECRQDKHGETPLGTQIPNHIHGSPERVTVGLKWVHGTTLLLKVQSRFKHSIVPSAFLMNCIESIANAARSIALHKSIRLFL
jgi:hypothetical protein